MAYLVHPLPPRKVWVKKEYLYDLEKGHGELTPGLWISVRSIQAKALYFETLLTDYGALFDKLPLSAFVWKEDYDQDNQLPLDVLELWDCFDYNITVVEKPILGRCQFFDNSLIDNDNLKQPDFKVCTQNYAVETLPKWWSVGHTDEWAYKTEEEEKDIGINS